MDNSALYWMIGFTAAATACLIVQVVLLAVLAFAALRMRNQAMSMMTKAEPLISKLGPIADTSQQMLEELRRYSGELSGKTSELLELTRKQLVRVDGVMAEATTRTRAQMDRIEMVMDDTVNRFQETTSLLQNGVVRPLRQLNAVTAGIRTALAVLAGGRRTTPEQATHDEEMFI